MHSFDPFASGNDRRPPQQAPRQTYQSAPPPPAPAPQYQALQQQGFSSGLIQAFASLKHTVPMRIWILDNSEAMNIPDAHRIGGTFDAIQNVSGITRWQELNDCVVYHAGTAAQFGLKTRFAMLNDPKVGPQYFSIGDKGSVQEEMQVAQHVMTHTRPAGPTPLAPQLAGLQKYIAQIAPQLRQNRQIVTVVLATQGLPTSEHGDPNAAAQEFVRALQSFENLPVFVVVRLCTDDENVFDFYNSLDTHVELPFDVLDDFFGESLEIYLRNPWLTYSLPLHRFREMGFRIPVLDAIDERALTRSEVRDLCSLLFATPQPLPDPSLNWNAFMHAISSLAARERAQWNPVTRTVTPWINLHDLNRLYGGAAPPQAIPMMPPGAHPYPQQQQQQQTYVHGTPGYQQPRPPFATSAPPMPSQAPPQAPPPPAPTPVAATTGGDSTADLKKGILVQWALQPPQLQAPRPIENLLGTLHTTFPPAFGLQPHEYFSKWKPFSPDALNAGQSAVIKRGESLYNDIPVSSRNVGRSYLIYYFSFMVQLSANVNSFYIRTSCLGTTELSPKSINSSVEPFGISWPMRWKTTTREHSSA
jgi:hypothetical protein